MVRGLGVGKETTFGTPVVASKWYNIVRENLATRKTILFDEDTVGSRQLIRAARGAERVEGSVELYLNSQEIGHLLLSCLGSVTTTGTGPYTHTFSIANSLPSLTLRSIMDDVKEKIVTGALVNNLEIASTVGKARVTANIIARQETLGTASIPSFTAQDDFVHGEVTITIAGVTKKPRRLSLRIANNLEPVEVLGDYYPTKIVPRKLSVTGSFELDFESDVEYQDFLNLTSRDLNIVFEKGDHSIQFDIDKFYYTRAEVEVRGRELLVAGFDFTAVKPEAQDAVKVVLVNGDASY
ncbi:MAG: phage tail tube protein [Nitrososphaerota archaeon]